MIDFMDPDQVQVDIKIVDFGALRALVTVTIQDMEIRGFKIIDMGDGKPWVAPPSREVLRDGKKEHFDVVRFKDEEAKRKFTARVIGDYVRMKR